MIIVGDHLVGNVYIKFRYESDADKAASALNNRNIPRFFSLKKRNIDCCT